MKLTKDKLILIFFVLLLFVSLFLRVYKLDQIPPSLSWDESANGYNAWTIANFGKDEWGKDFPLYFTSFRDDKHPIHIYLTAISVKLLGLSEFSTRLPAAIFGTLNVLLLFYLGRVLFNKFVGLFAAIFLAFSPYGLQFSRFSHELNFTLFFFFTGVLLFMLSIQRKGYLLPISVTCFGVSALAYHSAKIVVPPIIGLLVLLYLKDLWKIKGYLLISLVMIFLFIWLFVSNPALLGVARINQTSFSEDEVRRSRIYQSTNNEILGKVELMLEKYKTHFTYNYLFISGDKNPRHSIQTVGQFYKLDAALLIIGLLALIGKKSRKSLILLFWALLAPVPASFSQEAPHAARAMFMVGSFHLIVALGAYTLISIVKTTYFKIIAVGAILVFLGFYSHQYLTDYYQNYSKKYAIEWQYGMKQIVDYIKENPKYTQVYMTDIRSQPYIFFLYYLKTPLPEFLNTVWYNNGESMSYNTVSFYDKYFFGGGDPIESMPTPGVLYVLGPSHYHGLRHKLMFDVKEVVYYPDGSAAFYIISVD